MLQKKMMKALLLTASVGSVLCGLGSHEAQARVNDLRPVYGISDGHVAYLVTGQRFNVGSWINLNQGHLNPGNYVYVQAGTYLDGDSALNQDSTVVTETQITRVATGAQMSMVARRIDNMIGTGASQASAGSTSLTGGNSGPDGKNRNVWTDVGYNNINMSQSGLKWDANLLTAAIGTDRKFGDKVIGGLALTFSYLGGKTKYNQGNIGDYAYGVVPYASFNVTNKISIDAMAGYNYVQKHRDRMSPDETTLTTNFNGPKVKSSPTANRYFAGLFGNFRHLFANNKTNFLGSLGFTYANDSQKAFSESGGPQARTYTSQSTNLSQVQTRLQAGHRMAAWIEPYVFGVYTYDISATKASGVSGSFVPGKVAILDPNKGISANTYGGGLGVKLFGSQSFSGGLETSYVTNKDLGNVGVTGNVKYNF